MKNFTVKLITFFLYLSWWLPAPRFSFLIDRSKTRCHLTRFYMYQRLDQVVSTLDLNGNVLSISGGGAILEMIKPKISRIIQTEYPQVDMQSLPFENNRFDVVLSDQVIEHVTDPWQAVAESIRVAKPGGIIIHTSCFMNPVHHHPVDLWRFTPSAYAELFKNQQMLETGGWGNRSALMLMCIRGSHHIIPRCNTHPLHRIAVHNDPKYPIVTWAVARKH